MAKEEALREALLEVTELRRREASALRESNALLDALAAATLASDAKQAVRDLLASIKAVFECEAAFLVTFEALDAVIEQSTDRVLEGLRAQHAAPYLSKPRRVVDLSKLRSRLFEGALGDGSLLSAPLRRADVEPQAALACIDPKGDRFGPDDLALLERLSRVVAQAVASQRLARRNALLAAVIDGASSSVAIADAREPDLPLIYVNEAFEQLTGYAAHEVLGRNCRFLSSEPPEADVRRRIRETVARRGAGEFELRNRRRDGTEFWNRLTLYPVLGDDGASTHMVATQIDVTGRRAVERERDEARRRLLAAVSAISDGFLLVDHDGRVVLANARHQDLYHGAEWTPGEDFRRIWAARLRAQGVSEDEAEAAARRRLEELMRGGPNREETLADGRVVLVSESLVPEVGVVSTATDISRLKAAERTLSERAVAIDRARDGIAVTDPDGRFIYLNPAHVAMFGYARESELLGRRWTALYDETQAQRIERTAMPEIGRVGVWQGEVAGRARDGREVSQEISLTAMPEGGLICVTRDVSERLRARKERERLHEQLVVAQRQEAIGRLASGVAHDFNNLLSAIAGSAALLAKDLDKGDPRAAHAERILKAAESATALTGRLLDAGKRRAELRQVDLREPLREAADLIRGGAGGQVALSVDLPDAPVVTHTDPTAVLQIALNLGINARDAIGSGPGRIRMGMSLSTPAADLDGMRLGRVRAGQPYARITVADSGPGLEETAMERIFEAWYSTKGADGTGLGLSIVASLLAAADGALELDRGPDGGARFTVWWPLHEMRPAKPNDAKAAEAAMASDALAGMTILVAEDVPEVAQVIAAALEAAGAEVAACEHPADALEAIGDDPEAWSALVTDFDMPDLDGAALARRARTARPDLPIVLCTALAEGREAAGVQAGLFDEVVAKPVLPDRLIRAVRAAKLARRNGSDG